ncbi:MAG: MurT ligase domain-containing protein [Bacillota bacterium]
MKRLLFFAALYLSKILIRVLRLTGRGGSTLPGRIARRVYPGILRELAAQPRAVAVVTGTNGKTTTSTILARILRETGRSVAHNSSGANLLSGVTTSLVSFSDLKGRITADVAVLEVDEATVPLVLEEVPAKVVLVTNFFRDQLDRYGELEHSVSAVRRGLLRLGPDAKAVLNADDPIVASLGDGLSAETVYYGIDDPRLLHRETSHASDVKNCGGCGAPLEYDGYFYAHLGWYRCERCASRRPSPHLAAENVELRGGEGTTFSVKGNPGRMTLPGLYNLYNAMAALGAAVTLGATMEAALAAVESFESAFGRMERLSVEGRKVFMALAKNPTGFNQVLSTLFREGANAPYLMIAINDRIADGRDVSWLWDVDFEVLADKQIQFVVVSGLRAYDMAVRLKYAGVCAQKISVEPGLPAAFTQAIASTPEGETLTVLPTYTAMLELRQYLVRKGYARAW